MTEAEIIRGCNRNDRKSQKVLYDRYSAVMYAICLRYTHQRDTALDVLQDGFVKVFSKMGDYKGTGSFEGWMKRIFIHTAIDYYHKIKTMTEMFPDIDPGTVNLHESTNVISRMAEKELLLLISEMPHGYRMVFNLYVIEGYDHDEISTMLGITAGTSRSQLVKARRYLQMKLKESKIEAA